MADNRMRDAIMAALATVQDPEIRRPITDLGMVEGVEIDGGAVTVHVLLTVAGCPLQSTLEDDARTAVGRVEGVTQVDVVMGVMNDEQRANMVTRLGNGRADANPFASPDCPTRVLVIASGKGGVGKSSVTANLAVALAEQGKRVGLLDADVYGHSIPAMMGVADEHPMMVEDVLMPVMAHGVATMSLGLMKESRDQVIAWRGPMLDRALAQMLTDVYWGDLDYLLVDLPPGTGDMPMSVGRQLPTGQVLVVTTPNQAAAEVAERAGALAGRMNQPVIGVIENMSWLETQCPHCGQPHRVEVFGVGGGAAVADALTARSGDPVPLVAQIPLDAAVRKGADDGRPVVLAAPDCPAAQAIKSLAVRLSPSLGAALGADDSIHLETSRDHATGRVPDLNG